MPRVARRPVALLATLVAASAVALAPGEAASTRDYAAAAWTILPPGENGSLTFDRNTRDQAQLYDALTPRFGTVTMRDIQRMFKPAPLGAPPKPGYEREDLRANRALAAHRVDLVREERLGLLARDEGLAREREG